MPLPVPQIDGRTYDELREETLRRARVHNPAWTNFNASDPGVTLVELFAFMTESLLYRVNQMPDRNRRKFLSLLGIPLQSASAARGIVTFANERGPLEALTLTSRVELTAGSVPFRTDAGLDVLPVEGRVFIKRRLTADPSVVEQYRQLYASYATGEATTPAVELYRTTQLTVEDGGVDLVRDTPDGSLWIALLVRPTDKPLDTCIVRARQALAGRILNVGIVPLVPTRIVRLGPGADEPRVINHLRYAIPSPPAGGLLPGREQDRVASYRTLDATESSNVVVDPGVVQLKLPEETGLELWRNLDPLEAGVGDFPPAIEDHAVADRLITWIRIQATSPQPTGILWAGINAVTVGQRIDIDDEALPDGSGDPDQVVRLARRPVIPGSVRLIVATGDRIERWSEVDDLAIAGPEIPVPDPLAPPSQVAPARGNPDVFTVDAEAGELHFGDGDRGRRPPRGALLRATYAVSDGTAGNVGPGSIDRGPSLPPGVKVSNPVRTWGGADAETVAAGEKRIARTLQHSDRLVTAADFAAISATTPGVDVGRVEILATFDPRLAPNDPGDAPGVVTVMAIPSLDQVRPEAPEPDKFFLDAIRHHLDPRRLVTTEVFVCGPEYLPIWISVGFEMVGDRSIAELRDAVKAALTAFVSPLPREAALRAAAAAGRTTGSSTSGSSVVPPFAHDSTGWPLRYPIRSLELETFAGRVDGVRLVRDVLLARVDGTPHERIDLTGLQLPRLAGISVVVGDPLPISALQGEPGTGDRLLPVPIVEEAC